MNMSGRALAAGTLLWTEPTASALSLTDHTLTPVSQSNIQFADIQGMLFDELAAWFDFVAH